MIAGLVHRLVAVLRRGDVLPGAVPAYGDAGGSRRPPCGGFADAPLESARAHGGRPRAAGRAGRPRPHRRSARHSGGRDRGSGVDGGRLDRRAAARGDLPDRPARLRHPDVVGDVGAVEAAGRPSATGGADLRRARPGPARDRLDGPPDPRARVLPAGFHPRRLRQRLHAGGPPTLDGGSRRRVLDRPRPLRDRPAGPAAPHTTSSPSASSWARPRSSASSRTCGGTR